MYTYIHTCKYRNIYTHTYISIIYICTYIYMHTYTYMFTYSSICLYLYTYIYIYYIYTHIYEYKYIYIYIMPLLSFFLQSINSENTTSLISYYSINCSIFHFSPEGKQREPANRGS